MSILSHCLFTVFSFLRVAFVLRTFPVDARLVWVRLTDRSFYETRMPHHSFSTCCTSMDDIWNTRTFAHCTCLIPFKHLPLHHTTLVALFDRLFMFYMLYCSHFAQARNLPRSGSPIGTKKPPGSVENGAFWCVLGTSCFVGGASGYLRVCEHTHIHKSHYPTYRSLTGTFRLLQVG